MLDSMCSLSSKGIEYRVETPGMVLISYLAHFGNSLSDLGLVQSGGEMVLLPVDEILR
jgi:hypothetical protein